MTETAKKTATEKAAADTTPNVDVVAVPSLRADGTPDQTPGFITLAVDDERPSEA